MSSKPTASKAVHSARMTAIGAAAATAAAASVVAATLKKPGVTLAELRSAHVELQSRLNAYKTAAAKAVATSRLSK